MKYLGSKSRIIKDILPYIQGIIYEKGLDTYIEPFCGGANVICNVNCEHRIALDNNKYLIALLDGVSNRGYIPPESVAKDVYDCARQAYYSQDYSQFDLQTLGAIGFLASYNGRFFDGGFAKAGWETTKNGRRYRDYYQESKRNLMTQAPTLQGVCFYNIDYQTFLRNNKNYINKQTLFYCDPPYQGTKQYATSIGFDHQEFWNTMRLLSSYTYVLISEEQAPEDFICIWDKSVSRSIKAQSKSRASEKLFVYSQGLLKDM